MDVGDVLRGDLHAELGLGQVLDVGDQVDPLLHQLLLGLDEAELVVVGHGGHHLNMM